MPAHPPQGAAWALRGARWLLDALGQWIAEDGLTQQVMRDLGIVDPPTDADLKARKAAFESQLKDLTADIDEQNAAIVEGAVIDDQVFELLMAGAKFQEPLKQLLGAQGMDAGKFGDVMYAMLGLAAGAHMRNNAPIIYAINRLLMLGYEHIEDAPRFDPFRIYDRLTGRASLAGGGYDKREWIAGLGAVAFAALPSIPKIGGWFTKGNDPSDEADDIPDNHRRKEGEVWLDGFSTFKMGWEADPATDDGHNAVNDLLQRTLSIGMHGALRKEGSEDAIEVAIEGTMVALEEADGGPGVLCRFGTDLSGTLELPKGEDKTVKRTLEVKNLNFAEAWWQILFDKGESFEAGGSAPDASLSFVHEGTEDVPALRIGNAGESRFDIRAFSYGMEIVRDRVPMFLEIEGGKIVIEPGKLCGEGLANFFKAIGGAKVEGKVDGKLSLSVKEGLAFSGGAGLKARLLSNVGISAFRLDYLDAELGFKDKAYKLGLAAAGRCKLGPFSASLERFGFDYEVEPGHRGRIHPVPPRGIGLRIDGGALKGGGFLLLDYERGEFAGALELNALGFSLKALVIVTTKAPGVDFALLALVYMRWPGGLELGLRFTLNAVGGMIGINHRFDRERLIEALPSGALDDILFPADPVGDAPRIIASLRNICPIEKGAWTLGLMAELGWGSDYICSLKVGIIIPLDSFNRIDVLASISVICFKHLPRLTRMQLIVDSAGYIIFKPFSLGFDAMLRDSSIGPIKIHGQFVMRLETAGGTRFLISAGGFHPEFKEIPQGVPARIDRLGASYDVAVFKVEAKAYFALAAGTVQFGAELSVRYKLGPLAFRGMFGVDALIHLDPFEFEAAAAASVALEFKGHELFGVHIRMTVWGPDRWRLKGRGEFSILFWDESFDFDKSWGDDVSTNTQALKLSSHVKEDLQNPANWSLEVPSGSAGWVTLTAAAQSDGSSGTLAHPLSSLVYRQRRIPFETDLDHVGSAPIEGDKRFAAPVITATGVSAAFASAPVLDPFMIGEYVAMSDEERLTRPGFETLTAGVRAGSDDYQLGPSVDRALDFELIYIPERIKKYHHPLELGTRLGSVLSREAAGRSAARLPARMAKAAPSVTLSRPQWAAIDPNTGTRVTAGAAPEGAGGMAVTDAARLAARHGATLVEAFEVAA
jgi:hypothetical protein